MKKISTEMYKYIILFILILSFSIFYYFETDSINNDNLTYMDKIVNKFFENVDFINNLHSNQTKLSSAKIIKLTRDCKIQCIDFCSSKNSTCSDYSFSEDGNTCSSTCESSKTKIIQDKKDGCEISCDSACNEKNLTCIDYSLSEDGENCDCNCDLTKEQIEEKKAIEINTFCQNQCIPYCNDYNLLSNFTNINEKCICNCYSGETKKTYYNKCDLSCLKLAMEKNVDFLNSTQKEDGSCLCNTIDNNLDEDTFVEVAKITENDEFCFSPVITDCSEINKLNYGNLQILDDMYYYYKINVLKNIPDEENGLYDRIDELNDIPNNSDKFKYKIEQLTLIYDERAKCRKIASNYCLKYESGSFTNNLQHNSSGIYCEFGCSFKNTIEPSLDNNCVEKYMYGWESNRELGDIKNRFCSMTSSEYMDFIKNN